MKFIHYLVTKDKAPSPPKPPYFEHAVTAWRGIERRLAAELWGRREGQDKYLTWWESVREE